MPPKWYASFSLCTKIFIIEQNGVGYFGTIREFLTFVCSGLSLVEIWTITSIQGGT